MRRLIRVAVNPGSEPETGSAPKYVGTGRANPLAAVLSVSLTLADLGHGVAPVAAEAAVGATLHQGPVPPDLGGTFSPSDVADRLPALPNADFYQADILVLTILDAGWTELGRVKAGLTHGADDLLEVHMPGSPKTFLLPFTRDCVPTVDLAGGRSRGA